ncbi:MAG: CutA1 divalent ion tolerance protein [Acidobacteriaceae bacterium]|jgi:periplasmic divalent cation tolerance protein|nr:CutA1 divalent ion tolerance protein [Acidobacteriaceae bacterium]
MSSVRVVLVTAANGEEAERIARVLVEERLAACVNLVGVRSIYRWEGAIETAEEVLLLIKTRQEAVDTLRRRVHELHSYDVPEFLVLAVEQASEAYLAWILANVG